MICPDCTPELELASPFTWTLFPAGWKQLEQFPNDFSPSLWTLLRGYLTWSVVILFTWCWLRIEHLHKVWPPGNPDRPQLSLSLYVWPALQAQQWRDESNSGGTPQGPGQQQRHEQQPSQCMCGVLYQYATHQWLWCDLCVPALSLWFLCLLCPVYVSYVWASCLSGNNSAGARVNPLQLVRSVQIYSLQQLTWQSTIRDSNKKKTGINRTQAVTKYFCTSKQVLLYQ